LDELFRAFNFLGRLRLVLATGTLCLLSATAAHAGKIVFVQGTGEISLPKWQLELSGRFYGLDLDVIRLQAPSDSSRALIALRGGNTQAAVVSADVLASMDPAEVLSALRRPGGRNVALLILGLSPQSDPRQLAHWSNGALQGCTILRSSAEGHLFVGPRGEVTREVAGEELPNLFAPTCGFALSQASHAESLFIFRQGEEEHLAFVRVRSDAGNIFFLPEMKVLRPLDGSMPLSTIEVFTRIAPMLLFVRCAAGDRAWHRPGHYANLSIDDPWLTKAYGHLDYAALLPEMQKHNFHTTVAFVPWNYDRSDPEVARLFREHPDRLSVCIHGDNHDHREFADYQTIPLERQVHDIKQAIARMEAFSEKTGVPHSRVMVFPHGIAPELTLAALKRYNFLATANSEYVPLGTPSPTDPFFFLGSATLQFANFPSLRRYPAEGTFKRLRLAVNAFLENPLLYYGHEYLFDNGIGAFNATADAVNELVPGVAWKDLTYIARHLYRLRIREDGNYDVELLSAEVDLENPSHREATFFVQKQENSIPPIASVSVEGQPALFRVSQGELTLSVRVPAGLSAHIQIAYENDLQTAPVDPGKTSLYVAFLRRASDFRDITLSRYAWGRSLTRFVSTRQFSVPEGEKGGLLAVLLVLFSIPFAVGAWFAQRVRRRKLSTL